MTLSEDLYLPIRMAQCSLFLIGLIIVLLMIFSECYVTKYKKYYLNYKDQGNQSCADILLKASIATILILSYTTFILAVIESTSSLLVVASTGRLDKYEHYQPIFSKFELIVIGSSFAVFSMFIFMYFPALILRYYRRHKRFMLSGIFLSVLSSCCLFLYLVCAICQRQEHCLRYNFFYNYNAEVTRIIVENSLAQIVGISALLVNFFLMMCVVRFDSNVQERCKVSSLDEKLLYVDTFKSTRTDQNYPKRMLNAYAKYIKRLSDDIYEDTELDEKAKLAIIIT